jgi:hypothetical protein
LDKTCPCNIFIFCSDVYCCSDLYWSFVDIIYSLCLAIVKDRFVHHTSFLYKFSDKNMKYLQVFHYLLSLSLYMYTLCTMMYVLF